MKYKSLISDFLTKLPLTRIVFSGCRGGPCQDGGEGRHGLRAQCGGGAAGGQSIRLMRHQPPSALRRADPFTLDGLLTPRQPGQGRKLNAGAGAALLQRGFDCGFAWLYSYKLALVPGTLCFFVLYGGGVAHF